MKNDYSYSVACLLTCPRLGRYTHLNTTLFIYISATVYNLFNSLVILRIDQFDFKQLFCQSIDDNNEHLLGRLTDDSSNTIESLVSLLDTFYMI